MTIVSIPRPTLTPSQKCDGVRESKKPMFTTFFRELKSAGVPVTVKEYLALMEGLAADIAEQRVEQFYYLARTCLVKDERHLDKFDRVFGHAFKGLELMSEALEAKVPEEWLKLVS